MHGKLKINVDCIFDKVQSYKKSGLNTRALSHHKKMLKICGERYKLSIAKFKVGDIISGPPLIKTPSRYKITSVMMPIPGRIIYYGLLLNLDGKPRQGGAGFLKDAKGFKIIKSKEV